VIADSGGGMFITGPKKPAGKAKANNVSARPIVDAQMNSVTEF
jgi:hypothetical protein